MTLRDVRVSRGLSIGRPETSLSRIWKDTIDSMGKGTEGKEATTAVRNEPDEEYYEEFYWHIAGTGHVDHKIGLIRKDGTVTGPGEDFDRVDVNLLSLPTNASDTAKQKASGSLSYSDASFENRAEPYLTLQLLVPASLLEPFCHELMSGRLCKLSVGAYVDVFQTEWVRILVEPEMQAPFYIEEEHLSTAYLSSLDAHRDIAETKASGTDDIEGLSLESGNKGESVAPLRHLLSTQAEALGLVNQRLGHIRTVGILVAIVLLLMLLLK